MELKVIKNTDPSRCGAYNIARAVYAETECVSLRAVEALCSMIFNLSRATGRAPLDVASDPNIFSSVNPDSPRHALMSVHSNNSGFQMCLRTVTRMLRGNLTDVCSGATRFHHDGDMPQWATSLGYVAEIDGLLFYI